MNSWQRKLIFFVIFMAETMFLQSGSLHSKLDFEKALILEEVEGRWQEAIALYEKIVADTPDAAVAAQAQLRIGICYEKLGKSEARKAYQAVLANYSGEHEVVRRARQALARLAGDELGSAQTITVREFMRSTGNYSFEKISDPLMDGGWAISKDGERFVYTDWMTGDLVVYNASTRKARGLYGVNWFKSTEFFMAPVFSPDEKRVAYMNFSWTDDEEMFRIQMDAVDGGQRETVYEMKGLASELMPTDWSPDGRDILALQQAPDLSVSLLTLNLKDKTVQRLVTLNWEFPVGFPQYSPDGRHIVYDSTKDGDRKIYLLSADGSQERVLIDSPGEDDSPIWSPDGRFVIYRSKRSGNWDLYLVPVENGKRAGSEMLIKGNIGEGSTLSTITPDGRLFYAEELSGRDIAVVKRNDQSGKRATFELLPKTLTRHNQNPAFAPKSQHIAYIAGRANPARGAQTLRIGGLDGSLLKEMSFAPEFRRLQRPDFSPDGKTIALTAYDARGRQKILLVSAEEGKLLKVVSPLDGRGYMNVIGWSPDSQVLYASINDNQKSERSLAVIDIQSDEIRSTAFPRGTTARAISPDGNSLILTSGDLPAQGREYTEKLILRSLPDGQEKTLAEGQFSPIVWDFDSRHIFYWKGKDEDRLYRFSVETRAEELFLEGTAGYHLQSVSSDGRYLAFNTFEQSDRRMWVVENFLPKRKNAATSTLSSR